MSAQKSLLTELGEAIDRYRASKQIVGTCQPPIKPRNAHWLHWLLPNGGTILLVLVLILTQQIWARPLNNPNATSISTIPYQGRLADSGGTPVTGMQNMEFRIYDVPTGGVPLWEELWTGGNAVSVSDGLFSVLLGSLNTSLTTVVQGHDELYLGVTVGTDSEMSPRVQLGSVPFSMQALTVPDGSITTEKLADNSVTSDKVDFSVPRLLGYKTCHACGNTTESKPSGEWGAYPFKGANAQDIIEVSVTTHGNPVLVQMTGRYQQNNTSGTTWCFAQVWQDGTLIRGAHLDGTNIASADSGCSGSYLFTDLPAGTYTFRAAAWLSSDVTSMSWTLERQIAVYEY